MGKTLRVFGLVVATAVALTGCAKSGTSTGGTVSIDEHERGRTISVVVGAHVVVTLHSTYWNLHGSSDTAVVAPAGSATYSPCPKQRIPGSGCGTVTESFRVVGAGAAVITASRLSCGEALRCTDGQGHFSVVLRATSSA